ncbi:MAG: hypothetical protein JWR10_4553 [Rubritepida sp.]|nr:hypothetical protein [Rubritepida sp.]
MIARRLFALAILAMPAVALAQPASITVENPWTRAAGQGMQGGGFLTIRNTGTAEDRLVSASSPIAARVELHTSLRDGDVMRMRPVENVPVPANGSVSLAPGGLHMMMIGLTRPMNVGETVPVTLHFERAGEVTVNMAVQAAGARMPMRH